MLIIELKRLPEETAYDYHKRLIYGKMEDKVLSDVDYSELSELLYGQTFSSDFARKMIYGSYRTLQIDDRPDSSLVGDDLDKLSQMKKESKKLSDQRRELTKLIVQDARREHLESVLAEAATNLTTSVGRMYQWEPKHSPVLTDNEAVLVLCDWHYGMTADNIWNQYNTEICKERVKTVVEKSVERILLHGCKKLHIMVLGDMIHGAIHVGARVASEELVCEQIMHVAEILAQTIEALSQYVPETVVYLTYGNHARTIQSKHDSLHRDNMERLIPWWLTQRLKEYGDITVVPESEHEFLFASICGKEFCAAHGDLDTVKSSPRLMATLVHKKFGKDLDYMILADKHHRESFEELGIGSVICGSLCGTDEYANGKRLYSTPEQLLLIVNERDGVDAPYHIKCN